MRVQLTEQPAAFLAAAADYLSRHAVAANVLATQAQRRVDDPGGAGADDWYAVIRQVGGGVVGAAMRTTSDARRPIWVGPMPAGAVRALVDALDGEHERVDSVNGCLPSARTCVDHLAGRAAGRVALDRRLRLHEVVTLVAPQPVPGRLRVLNDKDLDLATAWYAAFHREADKQAGRDAAPVPPPSEHEMRRRIRSGRTYVWEDQSGDPVHLTGTNPPSFGVARVGPVYTPPEQRGRGWAAAAVHAVSTGLLAEGARVVLFTDLDNPTSNDLYERLGFVPVMDMAEHLVLPDP